MGKRKIPPKEQGKQRKVQNSGRLQDGRTSQGNRRTQNGRSTQGNQRPQVDRRAQNSRNEFEDPYYNPAKSLANNRKNSAQSVKSAKSSKRSEHRVKTRKKDTLGLILAGMQGLTSIVFMVMLLILGILPAEYLGIIAVVLLLLFGVTLATQLRKSGKHIGGKIFCFFVMILLLFATYYIGKANGALGEISGGSYKVDNMVVAVLSEDTAETIDDASAYTFGVQYTMGGEDVRAAVADINEKLGTEIQVVEYQNLSEQAQALHDGQVQAIIYNEGYTGILQETFENYSQNVKIIYQHRIKKELDNTAAEVEVKKDTFSVFISGIDVFGPIETNSRSDVNIVATINPTTHQILLTTTPRDYYVEIPGVSGGQKDKLTHAGIYGVDASMRTLSQLYDTEIPFYARVNFTSLIEIVDQLGGVDVESELAFTTSADSGLVMDVVQGTNHFNGEQALAFSRERKNIEGGDNQRGKNQQAVITGLIKKMISPAMLVNANGIINSVSGNVETNMSQDQIQDLIKDQLSEGKGWNIYSVAAYGTGDEQVCFSYGGGPLYVMQPDQVSVDMIRSMIDRVENGETLEGSEIAQ